LEEQIGVALFERTRRGLRLTAAGQAMRAPVERMHSAALDAGAATARHDASLAGTVRLTASQITSSWLLPPVLVALRRAHPEIQIELVPTDEVQDLLERAADIALRMVRPHEPALIARKLGDWPLGLWARRDYVEERGWPTLQTLHLHDWVGMDRSPQVIKGFAQAGIDVDRSFFGWRCDDHAVNWMAVRAGAGIGVGLHRVAALSPELVQVMPELGLPSKPVWLTVHRELHAVPRLRLVFDTLVRAFGSEGPAFFPDNVHG
jgi:DNA-binding transcriptional LysR family regulator